MYLSIGGLGFAGRSTCVRGSDYWETVTIAIGMLTNPVHAQGSPISYTVAGGAVVSTLTHWEVAYNYRLMLPPR